MKKKIKNIFGENLDVLIEGNQQSDQVMIFVHGFGSDKNEGADSFLDGSKYFSDDFITIRFDQSGSGESEGEDYDFQLQKAMGDVDSIIRFVRREYPGKKINISAHSMGTCITALLSPFKINKIILTSIPNSNMKFEVKNLKERIISRGGTIDEGGISRYPRSSGKIQLIGKDFWRTLGAFNPIEYFEELGEKTDLLLIKSKQDEVIENKYYEEYKNIKNAKYIEIDGDHNFSKPEDRLNLMGTIKNFLKDK